MAEIGGDPYLEPPPLGSCGLYALPCTG